MREGGVRDISDNALWRALDGVSFAFALFDGRSILQAGNRRFMDLAGPAVPGDTSFAAILQTAFPDDSGWKAIADGSCAAADLTHRDGSVFAVSIDTAEADGFSITLRDVTAARQEEARLRNNVCRLSTMMDIASDWFWETDSELRVT